MEVKCPYCNHNLNFLLSKDKFLWNARGNATTRASRIRNFTIHWEEYKDTKVFIVTGWFKDDESIKMGIFETEEEAKKYLRELHKQIEEINV